MIEHERDAEDLDAEVADLEKAAEKVQEDIDETKSDWESKKGDESVPGAAPDEDLGRDTFGDQEDVGG